MFKFIFSAVFCAALCLPTTVSAQGCGCEAPVASCCEAPAPRVRKKLKIEKVDMQVSYLKRQCVTNECGCTSSKFVRGCKTIQLPSLTTVDAPVDPCARKGLFSRLRGRMASKGDGCCSAPQPCGCDAAPEPAPCGCDAAAPMSYDEAPMSYEGAPMMQPTAAAPCCGG